MTNFPSVFPRYLLLEFLRIRQLLDAFLTPEETDETTVVAPTPDNDDRPLKILSNNLGLNRFDIDVLLMALAFELDPTFQEMAREFPAFFPQQRPTLSLALLALPDPSCSVLTSVHPIHYLELIEISPTYPTPWAPIRPSTRITAFLIGLSGLDDFFLGFGSFLSHPSSSDFPVALHHSLVEQIVSTWSISSPPKPFLHLVGHDLLTNDFIAKEATQRLGLKVLRLSATALPTALPDLLQLKKRWEREALLSNFVLVLVCEDPFPPDSREATALSLFVDNLVTPVIISSTSVIPSLKRPRLRFSVPPLGYSEQLTLWSSQLGTADNNMKGQIEQLASHFVLSPSAIQAACLEYKNQTQQAEESPNPALLWDYCRNQARPHLDELAQRLDSTATWSDLVLPKPQRLILEDIANHLKHRAKVYQDWGFSDKGSRGLGLCALFHGESGTGKTMAAEVLANHFRLDLYRIDLSAAISKYVGETEKNLRRIFDAAESGGAILLFDEADAIFGKRTEVNDSRDRYANVEISYLLQRIEAFTGLAILTSNRKEDLDTAFARRIRFAVTFTFPDASCRSQIWQCIFPSQTPTQGLDYQKLGQLKIAGGNIRNIALNAAFLAAEAEEPVMMKHILAGAHREYLKLKRLLSDEEIRGWVF